VANLSVKKLLFFRQSLALILAMSLCSPGARADQSGAQLATQAANSAASGAAQSAGSSSIAAGNGNMQQGQSNQNQAQVAMGAMQIAMGLLGLLAAAAAAEKADQSGSNARNMADLNGYTPSSFAATSPTGSGTGTGSSSTGSASSTPSTVNIDTAGLRSGAVSSALKAIESQYGIPGDQFMDALKNGIDPKDLLSKAPKNPVGTDTLNKIADGLAANGSMASDAARALASSDSNANPGGGMPQPLADAKGLKPPSGSSSDLDELAPGLSPEVKAAMAASSEAQRREKELQEMNGWSIFQLVHNRYKKLETMIYGHVGSRAFPSIP
jgi:hypothetical protein